MDARTSRRQKRLSKRQEDRAAEDIGGRTQANSGATRLGGGGDVRGAELRIECKYTEAKSYSVKFSELEKLRKQAIKNLEQPVLQFAFKLPAGRFERYAVITWDSTIPVIEPFDMDTDAKSIQLPREYLRVALLAERERLRLTFRKSPIEGYQFEVLLWDDFVQRQQCSK